MLGGGASGFYTRSSPKSDSGAVKLERHSSPDRSMGETEKVVLSGGEGEEGRDLCNCCMSSP